MTGRLLAATPLAIAIAALAASLATVSAALAFEHVGGYQPCPLCLLQRHPYYAGVPLALGLVAALQLGAPRALSAALFAGFAVLMTYSTGLAFYHSGVEWAWWEGPAMCEAAGVAPSDATAMLGSLRGGTVVPSCTDAVWRFLGLSFAGWNALISAGLAAAGLFGLARLYRYGSSTVSQ
jgi:disulfide bond formation protein DsbB